MNEGTEQQPMGYILEAGVKPADDRAYFELLTRASMNAGLGPRVVAQRWEGMKETFHNFNIVEAAALTEDDIIDLLGNPRVIRNRRKLEAVVENARIIIGIKAREGYSFADYVEGLTARPSFAAAARILSKQFRALGQTAAEAFLFSAGYRSQDWDTEDEISDEYAVGYEDGYIDAENDASPHKLREAALAILPDLERYVRTHGPGPDRRLDALRAAIDATEKA